MACNWLAKRSVFTRTALAPLGTVARCVYVNGPFVLASGLKTSYKSTVNPRLWATVIVGLESVEVMIDEVRDESTNGCEYDPSKDQAFFAAVFI